MKTHMLRNMAILALLILSGSCLEYTVTTVVNRDGTVLRRYEVRGDSSDIFKGSLKVPSGKEWKVSHGLTHKDKGDTTSEKSQYMYTASRTFKNVSELNTWIADDTLSGRIRPAVSVNKRFRWFYTYFHYTETYPMTWPFRIIPIDSYMTDIEQSVVIEDGRTVYSPRAKAMVWKEGEKVVLTPADSVAMNEIRDSCDVKMERWMVNSMAQTYIRLVDSAFGGESAVKQLKDKSTDFADGIVRKFEHFFDDSLSSHVLAILADSLTGSDRFTELYRSQPAVFSQFDNQLEKTGAILNSDSYFHRLILPGKVFATNAPETKAGELTWEIESDYFLMKPYVLEASSRIANPWIMVVTALAALALIGIVFIGKKKA